MKWSRRFNHSGVQFIHIVFSLVEHSNGHQIWKAGVMEQRLIEDQNNNSEMAFSNFPRLKSNYIKKFHFESYYKDFNALHVPLRP